MEGLQSQNILTDIFESPIKKYFCIRIINVLTNDYLWILGGIMGPLFPLD